MLDLFAVFTRGGALLWTLQLTALRHSPVEALNALIKSCLLEERSGDNTFTYVPKTGAHQALKWTFHNGWGLVFVAVYQKALSLLYVDELLAAVKAEFTTVYYKSNVMSYPEFTDAFQRIYKDCEARSERLKAGAAREKLVASQQQHQENGKAGRLTSSKPANGTTGAAGAKAHGIVKGVSDVDEDGDENGDAAAAPRITDDGSGDGGAEDAGAGAFDLSKLPKGGKGGPKGRVGKTSSPGLPPSGGKKKDEKDAPKKKARNWGSLKGNTDNTKLDFSADHSEYTEYTAGSESDRQGAISDADSFAGRPTPVSLGVSHMDVDDEAIDLNTDDIVSVAASAAAGGAAPKSQGLLGSFMSNLALRVVGKTSLTAEDLTPALLDMKKKLMERNVAEEIAQNICGSVGRSLEGQKLASFTGVGSFVARAFEEALSGILHKRTVDMLLDIRKAQERGRPYVVVFCGVNGVGKSTNLAKIAYWLGQHGIKVLIAACDTFRAGAVEQLKTHCARLQVPLYERGYEKDPAKVANEAIKQAEREGRHVVLVDTAGRMQDNEPLMRALSNLINMNNPNLVLFVGEALVGNDAVDQLVKFNRALHDLAPPTATTRHVIDGIVLTKFDTIDDKVGAAVSMVYASGAPIMFLGCGQTYADLKRLNVKAVVKALLK